jgi:hypothetical protein
MDEHLLFKMFLLHASAETQQVFVTYTIEYLKWRYGIQTLGDMKAALAHDKHANPLEISLSEKEKTAQRNCFAEP